MMLWCVINDAPREQGDGAIDASLSRCRAAWHVKGGARWLGRASPDPCATLGTASAAGSGAAGKLALEARLSICCAATASSRRCLCMRALAV